MGYFEWNQVIALVVMLAGGALGGYTGLLLLRTSADADNNGSAVMKFRQAIAAGVAAALIVPLFLVIASVGNTNDTIIKTVFQPLVCKSIGIVVDGKVPAPSQSTVYSSAQACEKFVPSLTLLLAFSVIIGVSYRPFFAGISQKVLNQLNDDVQDVKDQLASSEEEVDVPTAKSDEVAADGATPLPAEQGQVLQALVDKPNVRRSVSAIAADKGLTNEDVMSSLENLVQHGLAESVQSKTTPNSLLFKLNREALNKNVTLDKDTGVLSVRKKQK